jgi:hypothetical protein
MRLREFLFQFQFLNNMFTYMKKLKLKGKAEIES